MCVCVSLSLTSSNNPPLLLILPPPLSPLLQGFFYKNVIMPQLRGTVVADVDLAQIDKSPQCLSARYGPP